jgi:hypothetical protein
MGYDAIAEVVGLDSPRGRRFRRPLPWTVTPCSALHTWAETGAVSSAATATRPKELPPKARIIARGVKAFEEFRFRPMVPDFLHGAPPTGAYAAFIKESRMKFVNARELDRKSGCTLGRTWGTRPEPETVVGRSNPPTCSTLTSPRPARSCNRARTLIKGCASRVG